MENRKNIDDFFKKKLEGETFDFDEKYWAGAEALLDEDKRKRRGAFWWWSMNGLLGLALLITVLGLGTFWYVNHTSNDAIAETVNTIEQVPQNNTKSNTIESNSTEPNTTAAEIISTNTNTSTNDNNLSAKVVNDNQAQSSISQNSQTQNVPNSNKTRIANADFTNKTGSANATRSIGNIMKSGGIIGQVQANDDDTIRGTAGDMSQNTSSLPNLIDNDKEGKITSVIINTLPQRMVALMFGRKDDLPSLKELTSTVPVLKELISTVPMLKKRWQFGVDLGVAQNRTADAAFNQYYAGLFAQYRLNENWYLRSGAHFIQQEVEAATDVLTQVGYGFGNENANYQYKDKAAQYIEIPLALGYTIGKHSVEGGIGFRGLIAVQSGLYESKHVIPANRTTVQNNAFIQDVLTPYYDNQENEPFANPPVYMEESLLQSGTRETTWYQSMIVNAHIAYHYRLNARLDVGLDFNYRFGEINQETLPIRKEIGNVSIGLHTRIKF